MMNNTELSTIKNFRWKIVALFLSVALWLFFSYTTNPTMTKVFKSIPINYGFAGDQSIPVFESNPDMILIGDYIKDMSVTVTGPRNQIISLDPNEIMLYIDTSELKKGESTYKVNFTFSSSYLRIEDLEYDYINLKVDDYIEKTFKIQIEQIGSLNEDEYLNYTLSNDSVEVRGPSSEVNKIDRVVAVVNVPDIVDGEEKEYSLEMIPRDSEAGTIEAKLSFSEIGVTTQLKMKKSVDLVYSILQDLDKNFDIVSEKVSEDTVTIDGDASIVKDIKSIATQPVSLKGIKSSGSFEIPLSLLLPNGVILEEDKNPSLTLDIDQYISKTYGIRSGELNQSNIIINGHPDSLKAEFNENIDFSFELSGYSKDFEKQKISDIKINVDSKGLEPGEHLLRYTVSGIIDELKLAKRPDNIGIILSEK